jgi:hypothetical protein
LSSFALRYARVLARDLEAHHLGERLDGFRKLEVVIGHQEAERRAVAAAAEAVIGPLDGSDDERRSLLAVERAKPFVVAAGAFQRDARADHLDDVGASDELIDEGLGIRPAIARIIRA